MREYAGETYIWTLMQTAIAAALYPTFPPTWMGIEALQKRVAMSGKTLPTDGPRDFRWAQTAFADAQARFNFRYEQVPA